MEEPIQIPEDLSGIADDDLANLSTEIQERIVSLAEEARESDDALAAWEALIVEHDRINEEIGVRTERASERNNRVEAALSRFVKEEEEDEAMADETSEDTETEDTVEASASEDETSEELAAEAELEAEADTAEAESEVDEVVEAEVEEDSAVEAAAEEAEDVTDAEPEVEAEVAEDAIVEAEIEESDVVAEETEVPEVSFAEEEDEESEPEVEVDVEVEDESKTDDEEEEMTTESEAPAADFSETPNDLQEVFVEETPRSDVSGLSEHRPEAVAPRESSNSGAVLTARGAFGGAVAEGQQIDIPALAKAIAERNVARNNVPSGTFEYVTLASAVADFGDNRMTGSAEENFSVLRRIASQHIEDRSLVASGGVCAPLEPNYDFFRLAEEQNPVEQALPVAQASRGGIRYISPPDFRDASAGVRVTTEAEDAAGYVSQGGPTPDKPCVAVECPPILECRVDAVSKCVTFGNLNYRVFPEQVEAFLEDLSVIFTETKEIFYLDAIDAASTAVTAAQTYGATRSVVNNVLRAAENYRRRHHMAANATLELLAPSWLTPFLKVDLVNDHSMGLGFLAADDSEVVAFFAKENINVTLYYDSATGAGQAFNGAQAAGALNEWPSTVVTYLYAPGTFVRLDAGTLDLGVVRDSVLNGTNDLQIFAEQWVQVCQVGIESLRIEHTLCPDGTGPEPVAPLVCPVSG